MKKTGLLPTFQGPENLFKTCRRILFLSGFGHACFEKFTSELFKASERYEDQKIVIEPLKLKYTKDMIIFYVCKFKACKDEEKANSLREKRLKGMFLSSLIDKIT